VQQFAMEGAVNTFKFQLQSIDQTMNSIFKSHEPCSTWS